MKKVPVSTPVPSNKKHTSETFECLLCAVFGLRGLPSSPLITFHEHINPSARRAARNQGRDAAPAAAAGFTAATWIFRLAANAASAAAGGLSGCVFQPWAGGSCSCCSCRGGRWLRLQLGPLRFTADSECGH